MQAVVRSRYGSPEVLHLAEVEQPKPTAGQVLVRVHASAVNAADLDYLHGVFMVRPGGLIKPQHRILGSDIAGRVEAVGPGATQFRPGDEVYGDLSAHGFGAFAQYVAVPENALAPKPACLTFEQAAVVPSAAVVAWLNLAYRGPISPGQKVLINGAGGGMGTFALQMAKSFGAEVTGVDSAIKLDMLRTIGADHVIDYARQDFTRNGQQYDLIMDVAAYRSIADYERALSPSGSYVMVGGSLRTLFQVLLLGPRVAKRSDKRLGLVMASPGQNDLLAVSRLIESGQVTPVIDRRYPLGEVADALSYLASGHALGKVGVTVP